MKYLTFKRAAVIACCGVDHVNTQAQTKTAVLNAGLPQMTADPIKTRISHHIAHGQYPKIHRIHPSNNSLIFFHYNP